MEKMVNRRDCLKYLALACVTNPVDLLAASSPEEKYYKSRALSRLETKNYPDSLPVEDIDIKDYYNKIRHPNRYHKDDIILDAQWHPTLKSIVRRFQRLRSYVGHGKFAILSFDQCLQYGRSVSSIGAFTAKELWLLEDIFYTDAREYGFYGKKQVDNLTYTINRREIYRVPNNGNYLFKGRAFEKFVRVREDLGQNLILTSGIRNLAKQCYLFLNKAYRYKGNLSLASRSIAPPGYSYHAVGDFDVGQRGFGNKNFTEAFTQTSIYKNLLKQGYVDYRYGRNNLLGVRYEPWHIKV